jgi:hypothetical protein
LAVTAKTRTGGPTGLPVVRFTGGSVSIHPLF